MTNTRSQTDDEIDFTLSDGLSPRRGRRDLPEYHHERRLIDRVER
jgi:hypothetical protein